MKLGMMLEVDETFMTIWLSRSSEVRVKVRRWPQSLLGLFFNLVLPTFNTSAIWSFGRIGADFTSQLRCLFHPKHGQET